MLSHYKCLFRLISGNFIIQRNYIDDLHILLYYLYDCSSFTIKNIDANKLHVKSFMLLTNKGFIEEKPPIMINDKTTSKDILIKETTSAFSYSSLAYHPTYLKSVIDINEIYTIHYFEYSRNFAFNGERHNFWEFISVDRGEVDITSGDKKITLQKDEIAFHEPMEFHAVHATGLSAPNLIVVSFACDSIAMDYFRHKVLKIDMIERSLLSEIINCAKQCFSNRLDDPYTLAMNFRDDSPRELQQIIRLDLEILLLHLMRRTRTGATSVYHFPEKVTAVNYVDMLYSRLVTYLNEHISESLTISKICRDNLMSKSQLMNIFRKQTGHGVIENFNKMKIDKAKVFIRSSNLSFTQISERLGYSSIQYFSRQFRKFTGMSPTEYANSIQAIDSRAQSQDTWI